MSNPEVAIAKAALSATLFRADPTSISRPAVEAFFPLLDDTITQCSRANVQNCKDWIVDHVAPSTGRTTSFGKFLAVYCKSLPAEKNYKPSLRRRRLHILYIISDVLHHVVVRRRDQAFGALWLAHLPALVASAASFDRCPKHKAKLKQLVGLWEERHYLAPDLIAKLRDALENGAAESTSLTTATEPSVATKNPKDIPYMLPSFHGDSSAAWYDLPAGTWLPHMVPNSAKPMIPDDIRPVQLAAGRPDPPLVTAVRDLIADVDRIFSSDPRWQEDEPYVGLNEMGERVFLDEVTGQVIGGETYYGWSRAFCEKMKERRWQKKIGLDPSRSPSRSPSPQRSRSRRSSSSIPPAFSKRRRSSRSSSQGHGRDRSSSRSRSPDRQYKRRRSRSRSHSPGWSAPYHHNEHCDGPPAPQSDHNGQWQAPPPPPPPPHLSHGHHRPPSFPPVPPPGHFPPPPPPPAGYQGHWPPPPPPPRNWAPPNDGPGGPLNPGGSWGSAPPPPPPPPGGPPPYQQDNRYGRGSGGYRGRGRGGYGRGRGY